MDAKKFLLVLAACFLILVLHKRIGEYLWPPEPEKLPAETTEAPQETPPSTQTPAAESSPQLDRQPGPKPDQVAIQPQLVQGQFATLVVKDADQLQEQTVLLGSRKRGSGFKLEVQLSTNAASIERAWLTEFAGDSDEYKYAQSPYGQGRKTPVVLLSPVAGRFKPPKDDQALPACKNSLAISRLLFIVPKSQQSQPGRQVLAMLDAFNWTLAEHQRDQQKSWARFETTLQLQNPDQSKVLATLSLKKTYTLYKDSYDLQVEIKLGLSQDSAGDYTIELVQDGPTGMGLESARGDMRAGIYALLAAKGVQVKSVAYGGIEKQPGAVALSDPSSGDLLWAGVMNKFFAALLVPESNFTAPDAPEVASVFKQVRILPILDPDTGKAGNVLARLVAPAIQLQPGQTEVLKMKLFLGPKRRDLLKSGEYGRLMFAKSIQARTCCAWMTFLRPVSEGLLWLMAKIYWLIPNYGVAIILLVALVRVALHHFTRTSQMSMIRMSKMGPEIEKLKKKYGNNREELGRAQMALYKENKINPLSGCLPMALQMPVWFALFSALSTAVELRHAPFFWWINNLSGPDNITAYFAGGLPEEPFFTLPFLGAIWGLNLLPMLLGVAFFLQQKLTPSAGAAASAQAQQTKKMMYFMMAIFPLMLYSAPSGLNLYIMTSTFVGVIESHYIKKHIRRQEESQNQPVAGSSTTKIKTLRLKKK